MSIVTIESTKLDCRLVRKFVGFGKHVGNPKIAKEQFHRVIISDSDYFVRFIG